MVYDKYEQLVIERFHGQRFDILVNLVGWNRIDMVKKVAELLFVDAETDSILANETRKQLLHLHDKGEHCFG